jgi:di/tricarboxylate transporter
MFGTQTWISNRVIKPLEYGFDLLRYEPSVVWAQFHTRGLANRRQQHIEHSSLRPLRRAAHIRTLPLDLMMFAGLIACILLGFPVSFSISGIAILFAFLGAALGVMDLSLLGALGQRLFGVLTNDVLIAIPLFVVMGVVLQKSRIAEELLETMGRLFGRLRGGLGISVVLVGALLAASTGIVGATVIAMGLIALPTMLRSGYNPRLASGIVCTSGTSASMASTLPPSSSINESSTPTCAHSSRVSIDDMPAIPITRRRMAGESTSMR